MPGHERVLALAALTAVAAAGHTLANAALLRRPRTAAPATAEHVVVGVPARDEAHTIAALVGDLRAQTGVPRLTVHVLDDGSTDGTSERARAAAGTDRRIKVHTAPPPPPGWLGKPAAVQELTRLAWAANPVPDVLVLVDADVRLAPHALAASVDLLRTRKVALLSPWPTQVAVSPAERLVQPLQQWSWLATLPLRWAERSTRPSLAAANGQLLVLDADAHRSVGGHSQVAAEVVEDVALARVLRRAGFTTTVADGSTLARCRMYVSAAELRAGYGKSLWTAFGGPVATLAVLAGLGTVFVAPPLAALLGSGRTRAWGLVGWSAGVVSRVVAARVAGTPAWPDALAHPLSVLALATLTLDSARAHRAGTLQWKGRRLP